MPVQRTARTHIHDGGHWIVYSHAGGAIHATAEIHITTI